jgi:ABC-type phosphate transport system auxiliary subunit
VVADIQNFGAFLHSQNNGSTEFIPSNVMQLETHIAKAFPVKVAETCKRQELTVTKIAQVTQLPQSAVNLILTLTAKAIGHFIKNENLPVIIDMGLATNEVLYFDKDRVQFIEKNKIKELNYNQKPLNEL